MGHPRPAWQRVLLIVSLPLWGLAWLLWFGLRLIAFLVTWGVEDLWSWVGDIGGADR